MLFNILIVFVAMLICIAIFSLGVYVGSKSNVVVSVPEIKIKSKEEKLKEFEQKQRERKFNQILKNLEAFDGTAKGQVEIK